MSAFIVSKAHVDALVDAGIRNSRDYSLCWYLENRSHSLTRETANEVGQMLWAQNVRSVTCRYPDGGDLPGTYEFVQLASGTEPVGLPTWLVSYRWERPQRRFTLVELLKAIAGYEYQSCETPDWQQTEAYAFCLALRRQLVASLPGYDEADTWHIDNAEAKSA